MKNMGNIMKQAQAMQKKMAEAEEKIKTLEAQGTAGGGTVKVTLMGDNKMTGLVIDPELINADEADVLEDLIKAAYNDARKKLDALTQEEMKNATGGLNLPGGMGLPF